MPLKKLNGGSLCRYALTVIKIRQVWAASSSAILLKAKHLWLVIPEFGETRSYGKQSQAGIFNISRSGAKNLTYPSQEEIMKVETQDELDRLLEQIKENNV